VSAYCLSPNARVATALVLALSATTIEAHGQDAVQGASATRVAITEHWAALDSAWNARDAERFSRLFATHVSFEFVDRGESFEDRAAVLQHFSARFPGFPPDLRHRTTVRAVRTVADGAYAVDGTVEILRVGSDTTVPFRTFSIFSVMSRANDQMTIQILRIYQLPVPAPASNE
jgi:uncharacterized protein (TIGR02246 family)